MRNTLSLPTKGSLTILNTSAITCFFASGSASERFGWAWLPLPLTNSGGLAFPWIRHQLLEQVQQLGYARTAARGDEADRNQVTFAQALLEGIVQFLSGEARFAVFEIVAHHRFVDLDDLVDDALVRVGHADEKSDSPLGLEEAIDASGNAPWPAG
jgi:hypothetical protein